MKCNPEKCWVSNFHWLVGQYHIDEGLLYKATRQQVEDMTPVHIAEVQSMTEEFL